MRTFHFHVGSGRCGSTTLQNLLAKPQTIKLLNNFGVHYSPRLFTVIRDATVVPFHEVPEQTWLEIAKDHIATVTDPNIRSVLVTHENLFGGRYDTGERNRTDESAKAVSLLSDGMPVKIIIIVRRQDGMIESLYNQVLKRMETRPFNQYAAEFPLDNLHWDRIADGYATHFGAENIHVIPFEQRVLTTNGQPNYINAFFSGLKVPIDERIIKLAGVSNPSISPAAMEVQRIANLNLTPDEARGLADVFQTHLAKVPAEPYVLMDADLRRDLLARYRDGNGKLFQKYLPGYDPAFYLGD